MSEKENEFVSDDHEGKSKSVKGLNGLEPEMSLLSANFAPNENPYLNEHFEGAVGKNDHDEA
ncbi:hypothetical protein [Neobacillus soli]|uniref:hypothetical protein n=1 Tax=Neobacillus soli TaxID=220688 RepID=UPI000825E97D|nr:hypothetical protein [Neobacillus soli]